MKSIPLKAFFKGLKILTLLLVWCVVITVSLSLLLSSPSSGGDSDDQVALAPLSGEAAPLAHVATLCHDDLFCSSVLNSPSFHPPDKF
jgi:hypothetical protein